MSDLSLATVVVALRAWSVGYLPARAAVSLLIDTGQVGRAVSCGLVETGTDEVSGQPWAAIVSADAPDYEGAPLRQGELITWRDRIGMYSSGERAVLLLAASFHHGELNDCLYSLDRGNLTAFVNAAKIR